MSRSFRPAGTLAFSQHCLKVQPILLRQSFHDTAICTCNYLGATLLYKLCSVASVSIHRCTTPVNRYINSDWESGLISNRLTNRKRRTKYIAKTVPWSFQKDWTVDKTIEARRKRFINQTQVSKHQTALIFSVRGLKRSWIPFKWRETWAFRKLTILTNFFVPELERSSLVNGWCDSNGVRNDSASKACI